MTEKQTLEDINFKETREALHSSIDALQDIVPGKSFDGFSIESRTGENLKSRYNDMLDGISSSSARETLSRPFVGADLMQGIDNKGPIKFKKHNGKYEDFTHTSSFDEMDVTQPVMGFKDKNFKDVGDGTDGAVNDIAASILKRVRSINDIGSSEDLEKLSDAELKELLESEEVKNLEDVADFRDLANIGQTEETSNIEKLENSLGVEERQESQELQESLSLLHGHNLVFMNSNDFENLLNSEGTQKTQKGNVTIASLKDVILLNIDGLKQQIKNESADSENARGCQTTQIVHDFIKQALNYSLDHLASNVVIDMFFLDFVLLELTIPQMSVTSEDSKD